MAESDSQSEFEDFPDFFSDNQASQEPTEEQETEKALVTTIKDLLSAELTAFNTYLVYASVCRKCGFEKLGAFFDKEAQEEIVHAQLLIDYLLDIGEPPVPQVATLAYTVDPIEQITHSLEIEMIGMEIANEGIILAMAYGDSIAVCLLQKLLKESLEHASWARSKLFQLTQFGAGRESLLATFL